MILKINIILRSPFNVLHSVLVANAHAYMRMRIRNVHSVLVANAHAYMRMRIRNVRTYGFHHIYIYTSKEKSI